MITNSLVSISAAALLTFGQLITPVPTQQVLASHEMSLNDRYPVKSVSDVFKDNILLNIAYMDGKVTSKDNISWDEIEKPFHYELTLKPGEVFAFHDDVLDQYKGKAGYTTHAHFTGQEGFKSDGYLYGDGVCHLASLIYWTAKDAGLDAVAPTNHDFMKIPEIPKEYGVAIYDNPSTPGSNAKQNLYVTNNQDKPVTLVFDYASDNLKISAEE